jgi:hypothetical protein
MDRAAPSVDDLENLAAAGGCDLHKLGYLMRFYYAVKSGMQVSGISVEYTATFFRVGLYTERELSYSYKA